MPDQSVSREVVPGAVWCIATPFVLGGAKVGGRTSIIRLANGDLFVISPTAIEEGTKAFVDSIGKVKYLAAPNVGHFLFLKTWHEAYPEAEVIGPDALTKKAKDQKFDFVFTSDVIDRTFGENEVKAHYFPGHRFKEILFLHVPSGSIFNGDAAENLPSNEAFSKTSLDPTTGFMTKLLSKMFSPNNWLHNFATQYVFTVDKGAMKRDAKVVSEWEFDRLVPCHGDVMEVGGKKHWNDLYAKFLHP